MPTYITTTGHALATDLSELRVGAITLTRAHLYGHGLLWVEALCEEQARQILDTAEPLERRSRSDVHDADWSGVVRYLDGGVVRKDGPVLHEEARSRSTEAYASLLATRCRVCRGSGMACGPMQQFEAGDTYFAPLRHPCDACGATGRI